MKTTFLKIYISIQLLILTYPSVSQTRLWGLTAEGGTTNHGTLGYYDPATSTWTTEFNFAPTNPGIGARPFYTNLVEVNGKMYGLTSEGGSNDVGAIFEWNPITNVYTKKVDFAVVGGKGWNPRGSLTYANGKLYGLTMRGGANNYGVLFEWDPTTNIYTKKFDFDGINGWVPRTTMVYKDGKLHGFCSEGGINNNGVLFEWDIATNVYTKKLDLKPTDSAPFTGSPIFFNGKYYVSGPAATFGTQGIRGIYEWDGASTYILKFASTTSTPTGQMTLHNDKFYGITSFFSNSGGVIYEWDPITNIYTKKVDNLSTIVGSTNIQGALTLVNGKFYGMSYEGGTNDGGVIFEWDPVTNIAAKKIDLNPANGVNPYSSLTSFGGKLYGMTHLGGTNSDGVIFEWDPVTNNYDKKIDFTSSKDNGYYSQGSLSFQNGKLYGITTFGGDLVSSGSLSGNGVIFEWDPVTKVYTQKKILTYSMGRYPRGQLTYFNGKVYGMTSGGGGAFGRGVIFEWDPSNNDYAKRVEFIGSNGSEPNGSFTLVNGKFFGMTTGGGVNNKGVIFEFDPSTKIYTKKFDFDGTNGASPRGSLTYHEGKFYGMTSSGGANNVGVIFEWNPITNAYTKKIDLDWINGCLPYGLLTYYGDKFYGLMSGGGIDGGVIFEWNPLTNIYSKKIDLSMSTGSNPYGSLTVSGDKLYGVTSRGGTNNKGVLFEWSPSTNAFAKKVEFNSETGSAPVHTQLLQTIVQDQAITFGPLLAKTYGEADFSLSAASSSGLPISYFSSNTSVATVSGNIVKIVGVGNTSITAKQSGSFFFNPATDVQQSLTVNKANQTITFGTLTEKLINDASFALSGTSSSGLPITYISSNSAVAILAGNIVAITGAGSTTIKAVQNGNENYNPAPSVERILIVNKQSQSITFPAIADKTIGDASFPLSATSSSGLSITYTSSNGAVATLLGSNVTIIGSGSTTITAVQNGNENYNAAPPVERILTVNKQSQSITFPAIAAKTIGDLPFTLNANASSTLPVSYTTSSINITLANTQVTMLTPGRATIKASQSGSAVFNSATDVSQTFCVNPSKPLITVMNTDGQSYVLTSSGPIGNQWFRNGIAIQGANNMTLNVTSEGIYSVEVIIETCKSERSNEQSIVITGDIPIIVDKNFSIYPNPAKEKLIIDLKLFESHKSVEIYIYDYLGKVVQTLVTSGDRLLEVPIGEYSAGKYIIKAAQGDKIINQLFIKE